MSNGLKKSKLKNQITIETEENLGENFYNLGVEMPF